MKITEEIGKIMKVLNPKQINSDAHRVEETNFNSAKAFLYALENINPEYLNHCIAGELKKMYDFARVDIPLLAAANNKYFDGKGLGGGIDPFFDLGDSRLNAKLDLEPKALMDSINENFKTAKRYLDSFYPQLSDEAKAFMDTGADGKSVFDKMSKQLFEQREEFYNRPNDILVVTKLNGEPIETEKLNMEDTNKLNFVLNIQMIENEDQFRSLKSGERVRVDAKILDFKDESLNKFSTSYAVSNQKGETKTVDDKDFAKHDYAYGILMEKKSQTYFGEKENKIYLVPIYDDDNGFISGPDGEFRQVREILGFSHGGRRFFETEMLDEPEAAQDSSSYQLLRTAVGFNKDDEDDKILCSGEFHFSSAIESGKQKGPIIIQSVPWFSGIGEEEKQIATKAIEFHENRYEKSSNDFFTEEDAYAVGILMERNNRTYFLPMHQVLNNSSPELDGNVREVTGYFYEKSRFELQFDDSDPRNQLFRAISGMDSNNEDNSNNFRSGGFYFRSEVESGSQNGPIIISSVAWNSDVHEDQKKAAIKQVERFEDFKNLGNDKDSLKEKVVPSNPSLNFLHAQAALQMRYSR